MDMRLAAISGFEISQHRCNRVIGIHTPQNYPMSLGADESRCVLGDKLKMC